MLKDDKRALDKVSLPHDTITLADASFRAESVLELLNPRLPASGPRRPQVRPSDLVKIYDLQAQAFELVASVSGGAKERTSSESVKSDLWSIQDWKAHLESLGIKSQILVLAPAEPEKDAQNNRVLMVSRSGESKLNAFARGMARSHDDLVIVFDPNFPRTMGLGILAVHDPENNCIILDPRLASAELADLDGRYCPSLMHECYHSHTGVRLKREESFPFFGYLSGKFAFGQYENGFALDEIWAYQNSARLMASMAKDKSCVDPVGGSKLAAASAHDIYYALGFAEIALHVSGSMLERLGSKLGRHELALNAQTGLSSNPERVVLEYGLLLPAHISAEHAIISLPLIGVGASSISAERLTAIKAQLKLLQRGCRNLLPVAQKILEKCRGCI